jgi:NADPH:quinone reductase
MHEARRGRHRAVVQTTAASALGRMIVKLGKRLSLPVINVVRAEQVGLLRGLGAEYVVNSSEPEFDTRLRELCHRLAATIGFDAVAGEMFPLLLGAQPRGSRLLVYGALSLQASHADSASLIFERQTTRGALVGRLAALENAPGTTCILPAKSRNCCEAISRRISRQRFRCRKLIALYGSTLLT